MKRYFLFGFLVFAVGSAWALSGQKDNVANPRQTPARNLIETNKAVVRGYMEKILNHGRWDEWGSYFTEKSIFNGSHLTKQQLKNMVDQKRAVVPDFRLTIEDQIAEGDMVVTRVTFRGTHPTGAPMEYMGIGIDRITGGKVVEMWHVADSDGARKSAVQR